MIKEKRFQRRPKDKKTTKVVGNAVVWLGESLHVDVSCVVLRSQLTRAGKGSRRDGSKSRRGLLGCGTGLLMHPISEV